MNRNCKVVRVCAIFCLAYVFATSPPTLGFAAEMKKVMILAFPDDSIRAGMTTHAIQGLKEAGFKEGESLSLMVLHPEKPEAAAEQVKAEKPDAVIALNPGRQFIPLLRDTNFPVITAYGTEAHTDKDGTPKGNISGVRSKLRDMVFNSYKFLNKAAPIKPGKKAVFLNNTKFRLITQEDSQDALKRLGIPLKEVVDTTAYEDWQAAITKYNQDPDVGWVLMGVWPFARKDGSPLDRESEAKWLRENLKKPMVTYWEIGVQLGILCGFAMDLNDIGKQCGEMAARILKGQTIRDIKSEYPRKNIVALNLETARFMGVTFPPSVLRLANVIFKDYEGKNPIRK